MNRFNQKFRHANNLLPLYWLEFMQALYLLPTSAKLGKTQEEERSFNLIAIKGCLYGKAFNTIQQERITR